VNDEFIIKVPKQRAPDKLKVNDQVRAKPSNTQQQCSLAAAAAAAGAPLFIPYLQPDLFQNTSWIKPIQNTGCVDTAAAVDIGFVCNESEAQCVGRINTGMFAVLSYKNK
jgi:hypothetical protein